MDSIVDFAAQFLHIKFAFRVVMDLADSVLKINQT
jgi:hypothetical protein